MTTVLEYDKDGDVIREERCEDTEYFEPESEPKLTYTPFDGFLQVEYPQYPQYPTYPQVVYGTGDHIDPALRQPATCSPGVAKTSATAPVIENI